MLLSPDENFLYVALSNVDRVAVVSTGTGVPQWLLDTTIPGQKYAGTYPISLALSKSGDRLFCCQRFGQCDRGFLHPRHILQSCCATIGYTASTRLWLYSNGVVSQCYTTAGDDLLIATSKGHGTGPNNGKNNVRGEKWPREHPYIPTLLYGSIARLKIPDIEKQLPELTRVVEESNLVHSSPGAIQFEQNSNPIHHVIYIIKENRTYDQVFGDFESRQRRPVTRHVRRRRNAQST